MTTSRKLITLSAIIVGGVLLLLGLGLTSPVQTWVVRKVVQSRTELTLAVDRVSVGLRQIELRNVRADYEGGVLTLPQLEAEVALWPAAWKQNVVVSKLVARGWTLDLTQYRPARIVQALGPVHTPSISLLTTAHAAPAQPVAQMIFSGVLSQLQLPMEVSLDGVILEGEVILLAGSGEHPVTIQVSLVGGGFSAGHEGAFDLTAMVETSETVAQVQTIAMRGTLNAVMDTPRTFANVSAEINAQARGTAFPQGVQLTVEADAANVKGGENYTFTVQSVGKRLVDVQANFPDNSEHLGGVWRLDVRDTDITPFLLGHPIPTFDAVGAGMFETDIAFREFQAAGRINAAANRLEALAPELREVGRLKVFAEFDVLQHGEVSRINTFSLEAAQDEPVLKLSAIQTFELNTASGELKVANPELDLVEVDLIGLPVAWLAPLISDYRISGGGLTGKFTANAREGGVRAKMIAPLRIDGIGLEKDGRVLLQGLDLRSDFTAEYTARGWQAEVSSMEVAAGGQRVLSLSLKAGQAAAKHAPLLGTGHAEVALPGLLSQPMAGGLVRLEEGDLQLDFSGSWAETCDLQAKLTLDNLLNADAGELPEIRAELRAQFDGSNQTRFNLPVTLTRGARVSDLSFQGTLAPEKEGMRVEAKLSGREVWLDDLEVLSAVAAGTSMAAQQEVSLHGRDERPFWAGLAGEIELAMQVLHYTEAFEMRGVGGVIKVSPVGLKWEGGRAGMGEESAMNFRGKLNFDSNAADPYTLAADMVVSDFATGPLFRALSPGAPPQVEGIFSVKSQISATGQNAGDLVRRTQGDLELKSTGGVFRVLPPLAAEKVGNAGRMAALGSFIGNVVGGGKETRDFANKAQAVAELSKTLTAIPYDQLNVSVYRLDDLNTVLKDFSLISPEVRLTGDGKITARHGVDVFEQPLHLSLKMKVRGKTGAAFAYLGVLEEEKDDLGYALCALPLKIEGSLAQPDTSELVTALRRLAMERTGADDFLQRLLGR